MASSRSADKADLLVPILSARSTQNQMSIGTSATKIPASPNYRRKGLWVKNRDDSTKIVWFGTSSGVTKTTGVYSLAPGAERYIPLQPTESHIVDASATGVDVYGVADTSAQTVEYMEVLD